MIPGTTARPSRRYRMLDFWRGFFCPVLICAHALFIPDQQQRAAETAMGVPHDVFARIVVMTFYVISGYCISASVEVVRERGGTAAVFFKRRFRRIFPPFWAFLLLAAVFYLIVPQAATLYGRPYFPIESLTVGQWIGNLTLSELYRPLLFGEGQSVWLQGHAWTLCYEEQFYLVMTLALLFARKRFFAAIVVVTAGVVVFRLGTIFGLIPLEEPQFFGFFFDGHWVHFASGVIIYAYFHVARTRGGRRGLLALLVIEVLAGIVVDPLLSTTGLFALLLVWLHRWDLQMSAWRVTQPFMWLGRISYSMYLVHFPIVLGLLVLVDDLGFSGGPAHAIVLPTAVGLSVVAGWLFFLGVERRFMNEPIKARAAGGPQDGPSIQPKPQL